MSVFINIQKEIEVIKEFKKGRAKIIKGQDKSAINKYQDEEFLDLDSFATLVEVSPKHLMELISYSLPIGEHLAFYRNTEYKVVRLLELEGLNDLIRGLLGRLPNTSLLLEAKQKVVMLHEQIKEEK